MQTSTTNSTPYKVGYKLFTKRKDGTYSALFINKAKRLECGIFYPAEDHRTKGFAHRPGWHVCSKQDAPHLKQTGNNRVWCKVLFMPAATIERPANQGGVWYLGSELLIIEEL